MEDILIKVWELLGVPQIWGGILTVVIIAVGIFLKQLIEHSLSAQLEKLKAIHDEDTFIREQYVNLKDYSNQQAIALRSSYLLLFEPEAYEIDVNNKSFEEQLDIAISKIMKPVRDHIGLLDNLTTAKIYSIQNYLLGFKGSNNPKIRDELVAEKQNFWKQTEDAIKFVRVDQIAHRIGLISRTLEDRRKS